MKEKVRRSVQQAALGKHSPIIVTHSGNAATGVEQSTEATASARGIPQHYEVVSTNARCSPCLPASQEQGAPISFSDDSKVQYLRDAFEFLNSARLFHCQHCDEERVVFGDFWQKDSGFPSGGVEWAGPMAGRCETIEKAGFRQSWRAPHRCSRCGDNNAQSAYAKMFSAANLQHLGPQHDALSNLTWYESLLIARVHPVVSAITLTATGLLSYAGHVCNYYVKVMEWVQEFPAVLRDKKWFLVKRRRSILANNSSQGAQKKPTTANRSRLEAAFTVLTKFMPNVYGYSKINEAEMSKFSCDEETEMSDQETHTDLNTDEQMDREFFSAWLDAGARPHYADTAASAHDTGSGSSHEHAYHCARCIAYIVKTRLCSEVRCVIGGDEAWEICCRELVQPLDCPSLSSRDIAQLLIFWASLNQMPSDMTQALYVGMKEDLLKRGKTNQTDADDVSMKCRWVRLSIQEEMEKLRLHVEQHCSEAVQLDLDVENSMAEVPDQIASLEAENEAGQILENILKQYPPALSEEEQQHRESVDIQDQCARFLQGLDDDAELLHTTAHSDMDGVTVTQNVRDKPLLDPPEIDQSQRIKDTERDPYWIPGAFPGIFQNESGDPFNAPHKEVDLVQWGPHILRSKGWMAQAHMTFMYWWLNMIQRQQALSAKKWYIRDNPKATGYTFEDLQKMNIRSLSRQMIGYTTNIPGTKASKAHLRKLLLTMVRQIEAETRDSETSPLGDIPCFFGTLTSQRYFWDGIMRVIAQIEGIEEYQSLSKSRRRQLVNKYPLFVAWYCAVRLELSLKQIVVPLHEAHAYVGVYEWSPTGGMVHLHYILWVAGAPRFDVRAQKLAEQKAQLRRAGWVCGKALVCKIDDIVDFFAKYISEWNPNKTASGEDLVSHVAEDVNAAFPHTASLSEDAMLRLLQPENLDELQEYYKRAVRTEHLHDYHYPDPRHRNRQGPTNPR